MFGQNSVHYRISRDIIIKTENAAKPESQASQYLKSILDGVPQVASSFDYGCGKLRYLNAILHKTDALAVVDFEIQLSRLQVIKERVTSIREVVRRSNRISAYNETEFDKFSTRYDRGFCINVLSIVPTPSVRKHILEVIYAHLKPEAHCLFVVQYRNSDFTRMSKMPNARKWRDGFLINSLRGYSFFGLIRPERLKRMLERAGSRFRAWALMREAHIFGPAAPNVLCDHKHRHIILW